VKLIYVDESGNTGSKRDPNQPIHMIGAVIVDEADVRPIEDALTALGDKCRLTSSFDRTFEFHAYDLCYGRGHFAQMSWPARLALLHELIAVLEKNNCTIAFTAVDKIKSPSTKSPYELAFMFLVERLEDHLKAQDQRGLIVADENKEVERDVIRNFARYKIANTGWGYRPTKIERLIDSVHFVRSEDNHLIQMADLVAYLQLREMRTRDTLVEKFVAERSGGSWEEYLNSNATKYQLAVLTLGRRLLSLRRIGKTYPQ
jgi:hypothetical protein